jgi:hypothetical protein
MLIISIHAWIRFESIGPQKRLHEPLCSIKLFILLATANYSFFVALFRCFDSIISVINTKSRAHLPVSYFEVFLADKICLLWVLTDVFCWIEVRKLRWKLNPWYPVQENFLKKSFCFAEELLGPSRKSRRIEQIFQLWWYPWCLPSTKVQPWAESS